MKLRSLHARAQLACPRLACAWLLIACAALSGCGAGKPNADDDAAKPATAILHQGALTSVPAASPLRQALQVAVVGEQTVERPITVPATVEADPSRMVKVLPPVAGRIERLNKQLGDAVRVGEPLFTLDSADLAQAWSDAGKAQAALSLARHNLEREKQLAAAEIAARKDLEQAENDHAQAESEAQRAQARLAQLGATGGHAAGAGRHYTLASPIAGHVIELAAAQGGFWNDTTASIMTVADLSTVWLAASVQEKDLAAIFVGQPARITLDAYAGEAFSGQVRYIAQVLDADTRTVKVRVALANPAGRFRPGMFASVVFSGAAHAAPVVPAAALVQDGFNTRVFVERSAWAFEPRVVRTGAQIGDRVEIVDGLKAGERIVVKDGLLLND